MITCKLISVFQNLLYIHYHYYYYYFNACPKSVGRFTRLTRFFQKKKKFEKLVRKFINIALGVSISKFYVCAESHDNPDLTDYQTSTDFNPGSQLPARCRVRFPCLYIANAGNNTWLAD